MDRPIEARLRELLEHRDGELYWRTSPCNFIKAGDRAGTIGYAGYIVVRVENKTFYAHRVIWLLETGEWPKEIDHINHVKNDNRPENLREVTHSENGRNMSMRSDNTSGVVGVYWNRNRDKWFSLITVNQKNFRLYYGDDFFEAICARKSAEIKYHFHENHGMAA